MAGPERRGPGKKTGPGGEDDDALWARVTQDVTPLKKPANRETEVSAPPADPAPKAKPVRRRTGLPLPLITPARPAMVPDMTHGAAPGLDRRTRARMKRGQMPIEGRMDLHGLTQMEAHRALTAFLTAAHQQGKRCVLVITGKGLKETGEIGVLRQAVPGWLNAPPLRAIVHAFDYAPRQDGGEGALYILLRRSKGNGVLAGRGPEI